MKVLTVFGTRPEAIKLAPVIARLRDDPAITPRICVTGQHRQMLDPVLEAFDIVPDRDLALMRPGQGLNALAGRALEALDPVLEAEAPDRVLVHGDTTTALAAALAAFHRGIPVGHVEAGLRTGDLARPWPEEMNRRCIDAFAADLFAPTPGARDNLLAEGLGDRALRVTGNTVIDALGMALARVRAGAARVPEELRDIADGAERLLLVTGHRRESFGPGFAGICEGLARLAERQDLTIVYPVHLNPQVQGPVEARLSGHPRVHLVAPLDYLPFVWLMDRADLVLTDSGGVQEEAPALAKPVLVMREVTERPEAVAAGTARLVGTDPARIEAAVARLLDDPAHYARMARAANPYGDGRAAERIHAALTGRPIADFAPPCAAPAQVALSA